MGCILHARRKQANQPMKLLQGCVAKGRRKCELRIANCEMFLQKATDKVELARGLSYCMSGARYPGRELTCCCAYSRKQERFFQRLDCYVWVGHSRRVKWHL